jgi:hypothetical protein
MLHREERERSMKNQPVWHVLAELPTPECRQFLSLDDVKVFLIGPLHPA